MRAAPELISPQQNGTPDLSAKFDHICFVDVETTGFDTSKHVVIEFAIVRVDARTLEVISSYEAKLRPGQIELASASQEALTVNGYSPEKWANAVHPSVALQKATKLMNGCIFAGHNAQFDLRFMLEAFKMRNIPRPLLADNIICTQEMSKKLVDKTGPGSYKLVDLARYFNLSGADAHTAMADTMRSLELYKKLRMVAFESGKPSFAAPAAPTPPSTPPPSPIEDTLPMFATPPAATTVEGTTVTVQSPGAAPPPVPVYAPPPVIAPTAIQTTAPAYLAPEQPVASATVGTIALPPAVATPPAAVAPTAIVEAHKATKTPARTGKLTVSRGKIASPVRALIYGVEGVGKSSFAAAAENPIFLCKEAGTEQLDIARFPEPTHWRDAPPSADGRRLDVFSLINELRSTEHDFKTLVLDTVDWIEPLIFRHVCKTSPKGAVHSIELAYEGYGKGYVVAVDEWRSLLALLDTLRKERGMHIIMLGHAHVKKFSNPEGEDYDRYQLKMNEKAAGLLKEWCDFVGFAQQQFFAIDKKNTQKGKFGTGTNKRELFTERRAAWDAKNRYDLPPKMELSWPQLMMYVNKSTPQGADTLISHLREQMAFTPAEVQTEANGMIERVGRDAAKLMQILAWVQTQQITE